MAHVFISYSHDDELFVAELVHQFEARGIEFWIDSRNLPSGVRWREEIDRAIADAYAVIVVMSPNAQQSEYVTYEWAYALGYGKTLIPLVIADMEELHPVLLALQHSKFGETQRDWDKLFRELEDEQHRALVYTSIVPRRARRQIIDAADLLDRARADGRREAIQTLLLYGDEPEARAVLRAALRDKVADIHKAACIALLQIEAEDAYSAVRAKDALPGLTLTLKDSACDYEIREKATRALLAMEDALAVQQALMYGVAELQPHALNLLAQTQPPALNELVNALDHLAKMQSPICETLAATLGTLGDARAIPPLAVLLTGESWQMRTVAGKALLNIGTDEALVETLCCMDVDVRTQAVNQLVARGTDALPALEAKVCDFREDALEAAVTVFRQIGRASAECVRSLMRCADSDVRAVMTQLMSEVGGFIALGVLIEALEDIEPDVRLQAIYGLRRIRHPQAIAPLQRCLDDEIIDIRLAAVGTLSDIGGEEVLETLLAQLEAQPDEVCAAVIPALAQLDAIGTVAIPALQRLLHHANPNIREGLANALLTYATVETAGAALEIAITEMTRMNAEAALARIGSLDALAILLQLGSTMARRDAVNTLAEMDEAAIPLLELALRDAVSDVRLAAVKALGSFGRERSVAPLMSLLSNQPDTVRLAVVEALAQIGTSAVIVPLIQAARDRALPVSSAALDKLRVLREKAQASLLQALAHPDVRLRAAAAFVAGELDMAGCVNALGQCFEDDSSADVRDAAEQALKKIGGAGTGMLSDAVGNTTQRFRRSALEILRRAGR
jgi:HEAT repeat protein